jgi:RNA polymerase sigma factor (sigma-70 family)
MGDKLGPEHPRSPPTQLRQLLEAADGPDQERAWSEFLIAYSRLILYVARQIPRDHDVVMDRYAFVVERLREQSCRRLRTFAADGRGKFTTWLMVVVRRLCLDHDRLKFGRRPNPRARESSTPPRRLVELVLDPEVLDRLPSSAPSAHEELEREQGLQKLGAAVAALSSSDQLLLTLRYHDDRSAREIASLMSLPTAFHVYRRLNRVHGSLRQALTSPLGPERSPAGAAPDSTAVQYGCRSDEPLEPTP